VIAELQEKIKGLKQDLVSKRAFEAETGPDVVQGLKDVITEERKKAEHRLLDIANLKQDLDKAHETIDASRGKEDFFNATRDKDRSTIVVKYEKLMNRKMLQQAEAYSGEVASMQEEARQTIHAAIEIAKRPVAMSERRFLAVLDYVQELHSTVTRLQEEATEALKKELQEPPSQTLRMGDGTPDFDNTGLLSRVPSGGAEGALSLPNAGAISSGTGPGGGLTTHIPSGEWPSAAAKVVRELGKETGEAFAAAQRHFMVQVHTTAGSDSDSEAVSNRDVRYEDPAPKEATRDHCTQTPLTAESLNLERIVEKVSKGKSGGKAKGKNARKDSEAQAGGSSPRGKPFRRIGSDGKSLPLVSEENVHMLDAVIEACYADLTAAQRSFAGHAPAATPESDDPLRSSGDSPLMAALWRVLIGKFGHHRPAHQEWLKIQGFLQKLYGPDHKKTAVFSHLVGLEEALPTFFITTALHLRRQGYRPSRAQLKWSDSVLEHLALPRGTTGSAPELSDLDVVVPVDVAMTIAHDLCRSYDLFHQTVEEEISGKLMTSSGTHGSKEEVVWVDEVMFALIRAAEVKLKKMEAFFDKATHEASTQGPGDPAAAPDTFFAVETCAEVVREFAREMPLDCIQGIYGAAAAAAASRFPNVPECSQVSGREVAQVLLAFMPLRGPDAFLGHSLSLANKGSSADLLPGKSRRSPSGSSEARGRGGSPINPRNPRAAQVVDTTHNLASESGQTESITRVTSSSRGGPASAMRRRTPDKEEDMREEKDGTFLTSQHHL